MNDVIDLSTLRTKAQADAAEPTVQPVKTALLLIQQEDGLWTATPDMSVAERIDPQEVPDGNSMVAGLNVLLSDIQAEKTANMTVMLVQQASMAQMQAMQNQQIAANLNLKH